MTSTTLPSGYTVARIDGRWYPIQAEQFYTIDDPDGSLILSSLFTLGGGDTAFTRRADAVTECWARARMQEAYEQEKWVALAVRSNVYPERCAHAIDIIKECTGSPPRSFQAAYRGLNIVCTAGYRCLRCGIYHVSQCVEALTIEDALEQAAEACYTRYLDCMQQDPAQRAQHALTV